MRWLREHSSELLSLVIAMAVPLAGVLLAMQIWASGERRNGLRVLAAAVLGTCIWITVLSL
ncbi:MAG TPA: hypothetical protein VGO10_11190 [Baekduia sp.]|nr:hypothetical protein [Baekduia sp.]